MAESKIIREVEQISEQIDIQLDSNSVGIALLVSNDYKGLNTVSELSFTHKDADNLEEMFKEFTYVVCRKKNVSTVQFVASYKKLAEFKYPPHCKRILVYFSGHGEDGILIMQDGGKVKIEDVISCFKPHIANNETSLAMVKMFFFDACRGTQKDYGYSTKAAKPYDEITCLKRVPIEGNELVAYASTRYYVSFGGSTGSRWTNYLIKALRESEERDDVFRVLTEANKMMRKEPNVHCFQTAELTSNLADHVCFKEEAIKKRSILVIGRCGSGKSSVIDNIIGKEARHPLLFSLRGLHTHETILIDNSKYQCDFFIVKDDLQYFIREDQGRELDPFFSFTHANQRACLERVNLIIYVWRWGLRDRTETRKFFHMYTKRFKNAESISALVITHCEELTDAARTMGVEHVKSEGFAAGMGKGIYTVGFPNLEYVAVNNKELFKLEMQKDVSKLHQLIKESIDTIDVLKSDVSSNSICPIM